HHGLVPGGVAAGLGHAHADDGAIGRCAHGDFGARVAGHIVRVDDVRLDLGRDLGAIARGRAARVRTIALALVRAAAAFGAATRGFGAGARQALHAAQVLRTACLGGLGLLRGFFLLALVGGGLVGLGFLGLGFFFLLGLLGARFFLALGLGLLGLVSLGF